MGENLAHVQLKLGKRWWRLAVLQSARPEDIPALLGDDASSTDLVIIPVPNDKLRQRREQFAISENDWEVAVSPDMPRYQLHPSLSGPGLLIGPKRLVHRFLAAITQGEEAVPASHPETEDIKSGTYPDLPDPSEVPRFRQEAVEDPFGQNPAFANSAWLKIAELAGQMARKAHRNRLAVTLPSSLSGVLDSRLRPWRTVVSLENRVDEITSTDRDMMELSALSEVEDELSAGLDLAQRYLITLSALWPDDENDWKDAAIMLEQLGYLLVSRTLDIEHFEDDGLPFFFYIGAWAAWAHSGGLIYGDMHPANFAYDKVGKRARPLDAGNLCTLNRPLTVVERAKDLAILKPQCTFERWEAVKLGYRTGAPEEAEKVFQIL